MYRPIVNTYFSGAGGLDLGLQTAGLSVQQSIEIEPTFAETLRLNFEHRVVSDDVRQLTVLPQPDCDVMAFTYPCTKYSTIADIHGTRTGDELFLHALRHIVLKKPEAYVIENVPGMKKFPVVMEAMTQLSDYYVQTFCPIDSALWLPQTRKRLIVIATRRPFNFSEPKGMRPVKLKEIIEKNPEVEVPEYVYSRIKGKYRDKPIISDPDKGDIAPTCVAHYAKDRGTRLVKDKNYRYGARPYTLREYARLQGFPDWFKFAGTENQGFTQIGNAVSPPLGNWIGNELMRYFNSKTVSFT